MDNNPKLQLNGKNGGITFALFIAGYILVSILGQLIVGAIFAPHRTAYKVICFCFSPLCVLAVVLVYLLYGKQKFQALTSVKPFEWWYAFVAMLLAGGMFLGLGFVNQSIARVVELLGLNAGGIRLAIPTVWHFLAYIVSTALLPAIFEEVLFRGILLNCFAGMKRLVAVLISSLLFSIYHQSFTQLIYQFIYGVALAYLALSAKSVIPCIVAHFINNFTVLLLAYLNLSVDLFNPLILIIGANALAVFGTIIFFIQRKVEKAQSANGEVKRFFLPFGLLAIVICLALAVSNLFVV